MVPVRQCLSSETLLEVSTLCGCNGKQNCPSHIILGKSESYRPLPYTEYEKYHQSAPIAQLYY